ncbi:hypothetical protein OV079_28050 [Nannocystis pusilla]|uniref:Uncharacterized protein n=1 Tax=Nannocystis pusilla TaxID=889268 RepID=A0A9X3ES68_9BACT|nr:hypothetical protein [Nannocystis pusilla]MCY1009349.1 hypothetical protein [Nannocystis pusilla]
MLLAAWGVLEVESQHGPLLVGLRDPQVGREEVVDPLDEDVASGVR